MKQVIRINEHELHRLISESVKRVLNEEVDMGQIDAMRDTRKQQIVHRNSNEDKNQECVKRIRQLRKMIGDNFNNDELCDKLGKEIANLKKELGY